MDINTFAQIIAFIKANGGGGGGGGGTATAGVTSFNGRRNAVYPRAGDYNATMIMTSSAGISVQEALDNLAFTSTPDGALLPSSTNPVQNRVLYAAINDLKARSVPTGGAAGSVLVKVDGTNFNTQWVSTNGFMMKSTYDPDNDGVVQAAETAKIVQGALYQATLRPLTSNTMLVTDLDKGIANGVAPLDGGAQIPIQHIPGGVMLKSQYDPDNDGKVEKAVSAELLQGPVFKAALKPLSGNTNVLTEEDRGAANGVAPLDAGSKIPATHLPNDAMLKAQYDPNNDGSVTMADAAKAVQGTAYRATLKPLNGNTTLITEQEKGASLGVAPLDSNNRVPVQHMPTGAMLKSEYDPDNNGKVTIAEASDAVQGPTYKATLKNTSADTTLLTEEDKGIANGVVPLDSTGKILPQYLPDNIMNGLTNGGIFNATTRVVTLSDAAKSILQVTSDTLTLENTPTVPAGYPANVELYYITTVGGTFANMDFVSGDWLISLGNQWQQLKNGNQVSSVNGKTGAVQLISDEVPQGTSNLYLTPTLKAKLDGIENEATKDLNVIQDAVIVPQADGTSILKLTNKNGTVTNLQVAGVIYTQEEKAKLAAIEDEATKDTLVLQTATVLAQSDGTNILRLTNKDGTVTDLQVAGTLYTAEERAKLAAIEDEATKDLNVVQEATVQSATTGINTLHLVNKNGTTTDFNASSVYYTQEERTKLDGIQEGATKDLNVIQSAAVVTLSDGTKVLRLVNKNGEITEFQGGGASDLSEYLKQTGNAGSTYVMYTPTGTRQSFNGNETLQLFFSKVTGWLQSAEQIAFTGEWNDIKNAPTKLSEFINDGNGITAQPFITNAASDLYNYYKKTETYTKAEVDDLVDAISSFNFIVAAQLPTTNIDTKAIYYIPVDPADQTKGYNRYQRIGNQWVFLGTTDLDMTNFLTVNGDGSLLTVQYTPTAKRQYLANGETLASAFGKITTWINDLKAICFDGGWQALENSEELATQADLEKYLEKEWPLTEAGKALAVGNDGFVTTMSISGAVVRKGDGFRAVVGNDNPDDIINEADGEYSAAFGNHTEALANNQFVRGSYNIPDNAGAYIDIVGIGNETARANGYTLDTSGNGWFNGTVSSGGIDGNIVTPTQANHLTTKRYVDKTIDDKIAASGRLQKKIVSVLPDVADADDNTIYLLQDPDNPEVYQQWLKVTEDDEYVMRQVGSTETPMDDYQLKEPGDLDTTAETVSGAINELLEKMGDVADLETTVKTNIVAAINSLNLTSDVTYRVMVAGENVRDYADGVKGAYVLSVPAGINGNPSDTASTIVSIPVPDKSTYYQFAMSGNVNLYFRNQTKAFAAELAWQQMAVESIQQTTMPEPGQSYAGKTYQYIGQKSTTIGGVKINPGIWYQCKEVSYYGWLNNTDAAYYYTKSATPVQYDPIYNASFQRMTAYTVNSVSGNTMKNTAGTTYTRLSAQDKTRFEWVPLYDYATKKDLLDLVYPVGSIYIATHMKNPAEFIGGKWSLVGNGRVLWGVSATTAAGTTLDQQLPNIKGDLDFSGGSQGHAEVSSSGAFKSTNVNGTYPQPSGTSGGPRKVNFNANRYNSVYVDSGIVRPNAYTVHMWRRTA